MPNLEISQRVRVLLLSMKNRVAFVTESLFSMGGANRVLEKFLDIYPQADIYALFGNKKDISKKINKSKIYFSFLNKFPFIKKIYNCFSL